jgi:hypothetical protein
LPKPLTEEKAEKMFKQEVAVWYHRYIKQKEIEKRPSLYKKVKTYSSDINENTNSFQPEDIVVNNNVVEDNTLKAPKDIECDKEDLPWDNEKLELEFIQVANNIGKTIRRKDRDGKDYFEDYTKFMTITEALSHLRNGTFVKDKNWFKEFDLKMHLRKGKDMSSFIGLIDPVSASDNRPEKFKEITRLDSMVKKQQSKVLRIEEEIHRENYLSLPQKKLFNILENENRKLIRLTSELYFSRYNIKTETSE